MTPETADRLEAWAYLFGYIQYLPGLRRALEELAADPNASSHVRDLAAEQARTIAGGPR